VILSLTKAPLVLVTWLLPCSIKSRDNYICGREAMASPPV
jgi:hypothetical protein